jgi:hypothetical protein
VCVHGGDVDLRHDNGGTNAAFWAGSAEQISPGEANRPQTRQGQLIFIRTLTRQQAMGP